jgi:hypothetical protein
MRLQLFSRLSFSMQVCHSAADGMCFLVKWSIIKSKMALPLAPFESSHAQTNCRTDHTTAVIAKGANAAIQQLQNFYKTNNPGKRRQVLPLRHAPLADLRKQNWAEFIPEYVLNKDLGISVHLSRDIAVGGDATIAGAAVFTHSNVPGAQSRQSLFFCFIVMGELR